MFIQTEETPNPAALKFIPDGHLVAPNGNLTFKSQKQAASVSPLALQLFEIPGIEAIFFGTDFITITKKSDADWSDLKPEIQASLMDFFVSKKPVLFEKKSVPAQENQSEESSKQNSSSQNSSGNQENEGENAEIISQIKELIEIKVRPAVAMDGGDIVFHSFSEGIVKLTLKGSCSGCPSSTITLKNGIENMLKHYIPEVEAVEQVHDEDE